MDKSRVELTIFFIEKIAFSLKLFSGLFYGQSFIKTVRGPFIFKDFSRQSCIFKYYSSLCEPCNLSIVCPTWHHSLTIMGESSKFLKSWILEIQTSKQTVCLQNNSNFTFKRSVEADFLAVTHKLSQFPGLSVWYTTSVAQWYSAWLQAKESLFRASPAAMFCVYEPDTLSSM